MTTPTEPTTEAGRRLLDMVGSDFTEPNNRGMAAREWVHAVLAIEAEARASAPLDVERLAKALDAVRQHEGPVREIGLDEFAAIIAREYARLSVSGEPPCVYCRDTRWVEDENWSSDDPPTWKGERSPGNGLIPCGGCNLGGWDVPVGSTARWAAPEWAEEMIERWQPDSQAIEARARLLAGTNHAHGAIPARFWRQAIEEALPHKQAGLRKGYRLQPIVEPVAPEEGAVPTSVQRIWNEAHENDVIETSDSRTAAGRHPQQAPAPDRSGPRHRRLHPMSLIKRTANGWPAPQDGEE